MKARIRIGLMACLLVVASAASSLASVNILNISVSTQVLMEVYRAFQEHRTNIPMASSQIFSMSLTSDGPAPAFEFRLELLDGETLIAGLNFRTTVPVVAGNNVFTAPQITTPDNDVIIYNTKYINSSDIPGMLMGGDSVLQGNYRLRLVPINPGGPVYSIRYALFAPPSALNNPPRVIYPKNIEVNTLLPMFTWSPGQSAVSYEILVSPNQDPTVNTYWKSERISSTQVMYSPSARALENQNKYYWMIIAYDEFGKPIGGLNGKSQPAWFTINSVGQVNTAVSPVEADAAIRVAIKQPGVFDGLANYQPVALETTCPDLAELLRQLRDGSAQVTAFDLE